MVVGQAVVAASSWTSGDESPRGKENTRAPQLSRKTFVARLSIEEKLQRRGLRLIHFYVTVVLFMYVLGTYDPIQGVTEVHEVLAKRYDLPNLAKISSSGSVMQYIEQFIAATYGLSSVMIDANTKDIIDPARCFDPLVSDVCKLQFWAVERDPDEPNYVNTYNAFHLKQGDLGRTPTRPIVLNNIKSRVSPMLIPLTPLVWQARGKVSPCAGFGKVYQQDLLGAGQCPLNATCASGTPVTWFPDHAAERTYLTYDRQAFQCVDQRKNDDVFYDKSWYSGASWNDLKVGRPLKSRRMGAQRVFYKFVSDIAYLFKPKEQIYFDSQGVEKLIPKNDPMWANPSVVNNSKRAKWAKEFVGDTARNNWKNTFLDRQTKELAAVAVVLIPQSAHLPDIMTVVKVFFKFSRWGKIEGDIKFLFSCETDTSWYITVAVFWLVAFLGVVDNAQRHIRTWNDPRVTAPKLQRISDVVIPLSAICQVIALVVIDLGPPHVSDELKKAFLKHDEDEYYTVVRKLLEYTETHERLRYAAFVILVLFVLRGFLQLDLHPQFSLILNALGRAKSELFHVLLALIPIYLILAFQSWWMFAVNPKATGFESYARSIRTLAGYLMPGIPGNFYSQTSQRFAIWSIVGLCLRLFYIVLIASIVKAFMDAKAALGSANVSHGVLSDSVDVVKSMTVGIANKWPSTGAVLKKLLPRMKKVLEEKPNAVTVGELRDRFDLTDEQAEAMLRFYAEKIEVDGVNVLEEKDPDLRFKDGESLKVVPVVESDALQDSEAAGVGDIGENGAQQGDTVDASLLDDRIDDLSQKVDMMFQAIQKLTVAVESMQTNVVATSDSARVTALGEPSSASDQWLNFDNVKRSSSQTQFRNDPSPYANPSLPTQSQPPLFSVSPSVISGRWEV